MRYLVGVVVLFVVCGFGYADALEIPDDLLIKIYELEGGKDFLEAVVKQIEDDQEEINQLRIQRDEAKQEAWDYKIKTQELENELRRTKGLYLGGVIGYPFFTGIGVLEYRFGRWSPIILGGYGGRAFVGFGVNFRIGQ